ncbi:hypothetical protein F2Q69_00048642 [Brassica cretica]|uniref:Uncharacterized protein n=1 Tax=Brassica cretica TaxID=69181 RepID=A0A8S9PS31_BRACR|nr:hypothetical protein F2Q69_00048642 [Brassica cretica]
MTGPESSRITSASVNLYLTVSNVWSGLRRLRLPDQGLVSPASPVLLPESPSGRSAVPQTVLRLRTLLITSLVAGTSGKIEL